jgi:hypothetical protein
VAIAIEHHNGIHQVLKGLWPSNAPLFCHMANQDHGAVRRACNPREPISGTAHLTDAPRGTLKAAKRCSLDGVNDQERGVCGEERLSDRTDFALCKQLNPLGCWPLHQAEPLGAICNLGGRLFTGCVEDASTSGCDPRRRLQEEGALSDPWFATKEHE